MNHQTEQSDAVYFCRDCGVIVTVKDAEGQQHNGAYWHDETCPNPWWQNSGPPKTTNGAVATWDERPALKVILCCHGDGFWLVDGKHVDTTNACGCQGPYTKTLDTGFVLCWNTRPDHKPPYGRYPKCRTPLKDAKSPHLPALYCPQCQWSIRAH